MEVKALFGRFVWHGVNIDDVTIRTSRGSRINPTLKVCEHNRVAHASVTICATARVTRNIVCRCSCSYTLCHTQNNNHVDQNVDIIWHKRSMLVNDNTAECGI